jgi:hypothetical protein
MINRPICMVDDQLQRYFVCALFVGLLSRPICMEMLWAGFGFYGPLGF